MSGDPRIGRVIGGHYELRDVRHQSSLFTTYDAWHLDREQLVAVQLVTGNVLEREHLQRFRNEARVISRLRHPNIVELLDFGQLEDDTAFVVTPPAEGPLLSEVLEHGALPVDATVDLVLQVARGLRFAHQFGIFHLAPTPSRVRLGERTELSGFLEARWHEIDPGSPPFRELRTVAPEVLRGEAPTAAADVYALGLLAYACITSELPVEEDPAAARAAQLSPSPWKFPESLKGPRELLDIVLHCLKKERDQRLRDCDEVIDALERWAASVASTQRLTAVKKEAYFPRVGDVFADKYVIEEMIGQGGFARVFRARSTDTDRDIALKILRPDRTRNTAEARRFVREGKLVFSLLSNPHTISVYGYGESENGLLYIAFEFLDGKSLESQLAADDCFRADRVVRILEQCLVSLAEAHGMGVLHRDIKPSNIMLSHRDGVEDWVTVLDFGVAKITSDIVDRNELTVAGKAVGTPRYMSPEQISGDPLGPESDLYSLGLVTYELLTGEPAIGGENVLDILTSQLDPQSVILPTSSGVPVPLALIVNRLMRKERKSRYLSASDVLTDLRMLDREAGDATVDTGSR